MLTFLKSQTNSLASSVLDFTLTIGLVELLGVWYGTASVAGNIGGAIANFLIGRFWVFEAAAKHTRRQARRYAVVWAGYVTINFIFLTVAQDVFHIDYKIAKMFIAVMLSLTYNYVLQRRFVFK